MPKAPESRTYKRHEARAEVEKWSALFPGYKSVVADIRHTLYLRDQRRVDTSIPVSAGPPRR